MFNLKQGGFMKKLICHAEGCENEAVCRRLCNKHYLRMKKGYKLKRNPTKQSATCSVDGCENETYAKNLCTTHYQRYKKYGTTSEEALRNKTRSMPLKERLQFYSQEVDENDCFIWQGRVGKDGYGILWWKDYPYRAHRISYELYNGEIPEGKVVCHTCNNKLCVNPDHLYAATQAKNTQDAARDGLMAQKTGEDSHVSKLTREQAIEIIKRRKKGEKAEFISKDYGITHWTVYDLMKGKSWPDIDRNSIQGEAAKDAVGRIKNTQTKLSESQVKQLKTKLNKGSSLNQLAIEFNVSKKLISNIKKGVAWNHVHPRKVKRRKRKI